MREKAESLSTFKSWTGVLFECVKDWGEFEDDWA